MPGTYCRGGQETLFQYSRATRHGVGLASRLVALFFFKRWIGSRELLVLVVLGLLSRTLGVMAVLLIAH